MTEKKIFELKQVKTTKHESTEPTKYKVSDRILDLLAATVDKATQETDYEISENALDALLSSFDSVLNGYVHDVGCFLHHKDSGDIQGTFLVYGLSLQTRQSPYKFTTFFRHSINNFEEEIVYPMQEFFGE